MASTGEGREVMQGWISLPPSDEGQISEVTAEMAVGNKGMLGRDELLSATWENLSGIMSTQQRPTYRKQEQTRQGTIWPDECGRWKKMCSFYSQEAVDDVSLGRKQGQAAKLEAVLSSMGRVQLEGGGEKTKRYDPNRENRSEVVPVQRSKRNDRYHSDLSRFCLVQEQPNTSYNQPWTPRIRYRVPSVPP
ncbi:hypothetical protein GE21DRAFT_1307851 [Neurospora crassa]|uniref:Uncharacterized protein B7J19.080 n=1 Tax=Neurospora crassa TaxID=5141 RepID=Q96U04_NEUCS|nr:hypothetical protein GE21DRAFT_1307851 [Neurospora crassa]CAD11322.1 hypothetical protein [Neurospora crassa]